MSMLAANDLAIAGRSLNFDIRGKILIFDLHLLILVMLLVSDGRRWSHMNIVWLGHLSVGSIFIQMIGVDTLAVLSNFEIAKLFHLPTIPTVISAAMQTARVL